MSRRKKRREAYETRDGLSSLTTTLRSHQLNPPATRKALRGLPVDLVEDFRRFDPEPFRLPKTYTGMTASVEVRQPSKKPTRYQTRVPHQIAFTAPHQTIQCVRRQRRKEVMFAKKKAGKGKGQRRARWTRWSEIKC